jgi:hypothetical protein
LAAWPIGYKQVFSAIYPGKDLAMSDMRAMGADISRHQDTFSFRGNLDFIALRASVGNTPDSAFQRFQPEAQKVPVRGAYHYMLSSQPWHDQLQTFLTAIQGADLHFIALDFEAINNTFGRDFARAALSWLDAARAAIAKPVLLYTNPDNWKVGLQPFLNADERDRVAAYELWVAQWPNFPNEAVARSSGAPFLADGMRHWTFWQFSGDAATHPKRAAEFGVGGEFIDLDIYNGTRAEMIQRFGGHAAPVVAPPVMTPASASGTKPMSNQDMLNAFFHAAAALGIAPADRFDLVRHAGLESMAIPDSNRVLPYTGPSVENMPGLSDDERAALRAALNR